jgi:hypothetical protein
MSMAPGPEPASTTGSVPWARQAPDARNEPVTDRIRRIVAGLPGWDPMPPGEIIVVRAGRE